MPIMIYVLNCVMQLNIRPSDYMLQMTYVDDVHISIQNMNMMMIGRWAGHEKTCRSGDTLTTLKPVTGSRQ